MTHKVQKLRFWWITHWHGEVITPVCCLGLSWLLLMVVLLLLLPLLMLVWDNWSFWLIIIVLLCVWWWKGCFKKVKYSDFLLIRVLSLLEANKLRDELVSNKFSKRVYVISYSTHCMVNWILKIEYFVNVVYWDFGPAHGNQWHHWKAHTI